MSLPIPESDILKPRDPSVDDNTDEWPEFVLTNAHVHHPDDRDSIVSLLEASAGYPLVVVGQLEPLDNQDAHLYRQAPTKKRVNVVLEDVKTFSYGQYGDGSTAIWAAGKAGWYTIKPGRGYKTTYNTMVDAVNLLYFIADSYRTPRKIGKGKHATNAPDYTAQDLFQRYAAEELGSSDPSDGMEKFYHHKEFIMSSMLSGKEGLSWSKLPIYKHFYNKFPEILAKLRQRLEPGLASRVSDDMDNEIPKPAAKHTRKNSVDSTSTTSTIRRRGRPIKKSQKSDVISLGSSSGVGSSGASKMGPPVRKPTSRRTRQNSVSESTTEGEQIATPARDDETDEETKLRARKNKSSLRPRASKATKSAARRGGKGPIPQGNNDNELPSSPIAGKRKYTEEKDSRPPPKRRSSKTQVDEGIDMPSSPSVSGDAENAGSPGSATIPIAETTELAIRGLGHVPDSVQEDTWVCALDGCNHKVYGSSTPESQRLIKEHYALHAYDEDERVQMVKKMQAPSLPASHLMERVKMQAKMDGFPGTVSRQMASRYPMTLPQMSLGVVQRY